MTKLIINLNVLNYPLTGIGYYTLNIVKELLNRNVELVGVKDSNILNKEHIFSLINQDIKGKKYSTTKKNLKIMVVNLLRKIPKIYYIRCKIKSLLLSTKMNVLAEKGYVYFEPCFVPLGYSGSIITTIHDLSFIQYPEFHPEERVKYLTSELPRTVRLSSIIFVDSDAIAVELKKLYPMYSNKVVTLYPGVDTSFKQYENCNDVLSSFGLKDKSFILSVCTLEPRKNLLRLVEAYKLLPESMKEEYPLVLVGDQGWKNSELFNSAKELFDKKQLIMTKYISDDLVKKIYSSAAIFAYPSLYEGFGLPIVEAMASGTAVITSNYGAMAEVARDSAVLVNPHSTEELKDAIINLLTDIKFRNYFIDRGLNRAKIFSWNNTVDKLISVVDEIN
ncbi:glycosyltransferase family 4 protein [Aggregatibacter actinomycetemcomitans]|uniref:glycosyltransferase family 4 protein n=1 Tax=Aggregatibacter actinomycetemcomitans TaxID=714 RepID=UPI00215B6D2B|nr:glycosyltransferase family 1 protein [Aggregatibacter actinomycetemcomitans]